MALSLSPVLLVGLSMVGILAVAAAITAGLFALARRTERFVLAALDGALWTAGGPMALRASQADGGKLRSAGLTLIAAPTPRSLSPARETAEPGLRRAA